MPWLWWVLWFSRTNKLSQWLTKKGLRKTLLSLSSPGSLHLIVATRTFPMFTLVIQFFKTKQYTTQGYKLWQKLAYCSPSHFPFLPTAVLHFLDVLAIMSSHLIAFWPRECKQKWCTPCPRLVPQTLHTIYYTPSLCPQIFQPDAENSVKVTEAPGDGRITNWKATEPLDDSGTNYSFAIISNIQQTEMWDINLVLNHWKLGVVC